MPEVNGASQKSIGALLFLTSGMTTFDAYSTLMSSPWTAENVGADADKAKSIAEYVVHAVGFSMGYAAVSSYLASSYMPLIGAAIANGYLWWIYQRATRRAINTGYTGGWLKNDSSPSQEG